MRIVITMLHYYPDRPSGSTRLAFDEAQYLAQLGHEVWVVTQDLSGSKPEYSGEDGLHVLRYPTPILGWLSPRRLRIHQQLTRRVLKRYIEGPVNVVHGHSLLEYDGAISLYPRSRRCYSIHSPVRQETLASSRDLLWPGRVRAQLVGRLHHWIEARVLRASAVITAFSEYTKTQIGQAHHQQLGDRVQVIPGWVDLERFQIVADREAAKRQLGWPLDRPVLFTLRRLVPRMGLDNLLHAARLVKAAGLNFYLAIGGQGPLRPRLETIIQELELTDKVHLLGFVPDEALPAMYGAADAFVLPTTELECFGLPTIESLACGRPVLATPVAAIPEVLSPVEPQWLAQGNSEQAIAQLLIAFLKGQLPIHEPQELRRDVASRYARELVLPQLTSVVSG